MKPTFPPSSCLLLLLSLLSPAAAASSSSAKCAPRTLPYTRLLADFLEPTAASSSPVDSPLRAPSPSPSPSPLKPCPARAPSPSPQRVITLPRPLAHPPTPIPSHDDDDTVKAICNKTDHPDICILAIRLVDPLVHHADAESVLKLILKAATARAQVALDKAKKLMAEVPKKNKITRSIYSVCTEGYEDALSDIEEAVGALERRDKGALESYLSALVPDFTDCGDAFSEANDQSPLQEEEDMLGKLASNCLAIAELVE